MIGASTLGVVLKQDAVFLSEKGIHHAMDQSSSGVGDFHRLLFWTGIRGVHNARISQITRRCRVKHHQVPMLIVLLVCVFALLVLRESD